jgi:hypothetical protein
MVNNQKLNNQVSLNSLSRTPNGQIYQQDLKNIFSTLLFCLDLKNETKKQSSSILKFKFKKEYIYSFTLSQAIEQMANLHLDLQYNTTVTIFSYNVRPKFALELLQLFYAAKLLHCPNDETCKNISEISEILQPTPKGVAILHQFCLKLGIANIKGLELPPILKSNFNSMQLITFDRHFRSDKIIHNEQSDKLLFIRVMGPKENIWSSKNDSDSILDLGSKLMTKSKIMNSQIYGTNSENNPLEDGEAFLSYLRQRQMDPLSEEGEIKHEYSDDTNSPKIKLQVSPFYHRFFSNPDSDSHTQYYVSNKGVRFFKQKKIEIGGKEKTIKNCFSGKALIQYLMDCTDLMYLNDALKIANIFLKADLITCQTSDNKNFLFSKDSLYTVSSIGSKLVRWSESEIKDITSSVSNLRNLSNNEISFNQALGDPGLKYSLRDFMVDNMCVENLDVFDDIIDFQKKMKVLKKMVFLKAREKKKHLTELKSNNIIFSDLKSNTLKHKKLTIYTAINKLSESCLSKAYNIFSMYISEDAPNEINIDSKLRFQVQNYIESEVNFDTSIINVTDLKERIDISMRDNEDNNIINEIEQLSTDTLEIEQNQVSQEEPTIKPVTSTPNLVLNLKHLRQNETSIVSPTDVIFAPKLKFLDDISVFYEEIKRKVYKMMETDSYSKFLASKQYKENCTFY